MLRAIKALENYIEDNFNENTMLVQEHLAFMKTKVTDIRGEFDRLEKEVETIRITSKNKLADMQRRIVEAETREKLNIERQKTFGDTQTRVETERRPP